MRSTSLAVALKSRFPALIERATRIEHLLVLLCRLSGDLGLLVLARPVGRVDLTPLNLNESLTIPVGPKASAPVGAKFDSQHKQVRK